MTSHRRRATFGRLMREIGRAIGTGLTVFLGVLSGIGGSRGGPLLPPTERPPLPRDEYRP